MQRAVISAPGGFGRVRGEVPRRRSVRRQTRAQPIALTANAKTYERMRDLPGLLALWPWELEDTSLEAHQKLVAQLRKALRAERQRGIAGHWTYDVARHARLLAAYRSEADSLESRLLRQSGNGGGRLPS